MVRNVDYKCWLNFAQWWPSRAKRYRDQLIVSCFGMGISRTVKEELGGLSELTGKDSFAVHAEPQAETSVIAAVDYLENGGLLDEGYIVRAAKAGDKVQVVISSPSERGLLYGTFAFLRQLQAGRGLEKIDILENPKNELRMLNHWDNFDGSIERGYAGRSIFYNRNELVDDLGRIQDYARLLASLGINSIAINNVNVHYLETTFIEERLDLVKTLADIFRPYGIKLFLSINYASPMQLAGLETADPLDPDVQQWWIDQTAKVYEQIPDLGDSWSRQTQKTARPTMAQPRTGPICWGAP